MSSGVQLQIVSLLRLTGAEADARHLQSVTQQLSQATSEILTLTNQLKSSQSEAVSCDLLKSAHICASAVFQPGIILAHSGNG